MYRLDPVFVREKNPEKNSFIYWKTGGCCWSSLYDCQNLNIVYNRFLELCTEIYNDCFPLKKVTRKQRRLKKPRLTKALLKSIKKKNYLHKKYLPSMDDDLRYKSYKNKLIHTLRSANISVCILRRNWRTLNQIPMLLGKF